MSQPRALIADDVEEMRVLLTRTLESLGITTVGVFDNGADAMKEIESLKPDICFLDIDMPQMTGLEMLDAIGDRRIVTYPVIISGHSTADNLKIAIGKGAKGFVVKPYTFDKIKQITERFINSFYKMRNG